MKKIEFGTILGVILLCVIVPMMKFHEIIYHFFTPESGGGGNVAAFIRFKDEIKTLPAMLASIEGVFDKVVMIYSNEQDDGSIAYAQNWCMQQSNCEIHMYPYSVVPSHDVRYQLRHVDKKNSLAAYYNFGLQFFEPEEYIVKIDADQVYLTNVLKKAIARIRENGGSPKIRYGLKGHNTFVWKNKLVRFRPHPVNGGGDHFIIKRKHILKFRQTPFYEQMVPVSGLIYEELPGRYWFHFMKALKSGGKITTLSNSRLEWRETVPMTDQVAFELEIRPLLKKVNSFYRNISF